LVVSENFEQSSSNSIINILNGQPDICEVLAVNEKKRQRAYAKFLVNALADQFTIDRKQAEQLLGLASGASQAAAPHYQRTGTNKAEMIENTVRFIFGGIESLLPQRVNVHFLAIDS